jgi:hypothetical protein
MDRSAKHYCCGTALFLLSLLAKLHKVVIHQAVDAPGYGKHVVDGLNNAMDKLHLKQKMSMVCTPEEIESNSHMSVLSMVEEKAKSLAEECARLCSDSRQ